MRVHSQRWMCCSREEGMPICTLYIAGWVGSLKVAGTTSKARITLLGHSSCNGVASIHPTTSIQPTQPTCSTSVTSG